MALDRVEADAAETLAFGGPSPAGSSTAIPSQPEAPISRLLTWRLLWEHAEAVREWTRWARSYLNDWDSTARTDERTAAGMHELRTALRQAR